MQLRDDASHLECTENSQAYRREYCRGLEHLKDAWKALGFEAPDKGQNCEDLCAQASDSQKHSAIGAAARQAS